MKQILYTSKLKSSRLATLVSASFLSKIGGRLAKQAEAFFSAAAVARLANSSTYLWTPFLLFPCLLCGAKIVALGDLIIDHTLYMSDEKIKSYCKDTQSSEQVSEKALRGLLEGGGDVKIGPGGSAANTLVALAELGHNCNLLGKLGKDDLGALYKRAMQDNNVSVYHATSTSSKTAEVLCLINKETKERSMLAFLGASLEMTPSELKAEPFLEANLLHVEAYSLYRMPVLKKALALAENHNLKVSIDLASHTLVSNFRAELQEIIKNSVDIVFAHADEATALTGLSNPREAALEIAKSCEIAVIHMGEEGGFVASSGHIFNYSAIKVPNCIDTTGAGDIFAAGFLHGYLSGWHLEYCAKAGALLGAAIVQVEGAQLPKGRSKNILR